MDEKTVIKNIKDNYVAYTLVCYVISLIYTRAYYHYFNLPIEYYISVTDLLIDGFSVFLGDFVITLLALFLFLIPLEDDYLLSKNASLISAGYITAAVILIIIFEDYLFTFQISDYITMPWIYLSCIAVYRNYVINRFYDDRIPIMGMVAAILLGFGIFGKAWLSARNAQHSPKVNVAFKYHDDFVITSPDSLYYIGETNSHLFLYRKVAGMCHAYKKDELKVITYLPERGLIRNKKAKLKKKASPGKNPH